MIRHTPSINITTLQRHSPAFMEEIFIPLLPDDPVYSIVDQLRDNTSSLESSLRLLDRLRYYSEKRMLLIKYVTQINNNEKTIFLNKHTLFRLENVFIHGVSLETGEHSLGEYLNDVFIEAIGRVLVYEVNTRVNLVREIDSSQSRWKR